MTRGVDGDVPSAGWPDSGGYGRPYDPEKRRAAEILESRNPAWLVIYGSYSRLLWAYSRFATHDGRSVVIAEGEPEQLAERMRTVELLRRAR